MAIASQRSAHVARRAAVTDPERDVNPIGHQVDPPVGDEHVEGHRGVAPTERSLNEGNAELVRGVYTDDAVFIGAPFPTTTGKEAIVALYADLLSKLAFNVKFEVLQPRAEGTMTARLRVGLVGADAGGRGWAPLAVPPRLDAIPPNIAGPARNVAGLYRAFARAIAERAAFKPDFGHAVAVHELLESLVRSSQEGRAVS